MKLFASFNKILIFSTFLISLNQITFSNNKKINKEHKLIKFPTNKAQIKQNFDDSILFLQLKTSSKLQKSIGIKSNDCTEYFHKKNKFIADISSTYKSNK